MRWLILLGTMIALWVALWGLWQMRFERSTGFPVCRSLDIQRSAPQVAGVEWTTSNDPPVMHVTVGAGNPQVSARFAIPGIPSAEMLHLKFQMTARGLVQGPEKWQDGRLMVEWCCPESGRKLRSDPVCSVRNDESIEVPHLVVLANKGGGVPFLRVENLGLSGTFEVSGLEVLVVHERMIWKFGKWLLAAGWLIWVMCFIQSWSVKSRWRVIAAAVLWLMMALQLVVPGPWKGQKPWITGFQLGAAQENVIATDEIPARSAPVTATGGVPALGEMPVQGGWVLMVKLWLAQARPFLHALMLFGPSWVMITLIGRNPSVGLAILLAISIEAAQTAFGYGFNGTDVADLIWDAIGIWLAVWVHAKLAKRWKMILAD